MRKFRPDQCPLCKNHNAHEPWVKNEEVNSYGHCLPPKYYGFAGRLPDYFCGEAKRKCQDFEAKT